MPRSNNVATACANSAGTFLGMFKRLSGGINYSEHPTGRGRPFGVEFLEQHSAIRLDCVFLYPGNFVRFIDKSHHAGAGLKPTPPRDFLKNEATTPPIPTIKPTRKPYCQAFGGGWRMPSGSKTSFSFCANVWPHARFDFHPVLLIHFQSRYSSMVNPASFRIRTARPLPISHPV